MDHVIREEANILYETEFKITEGHPRTTTSVDLLICSKYQLTKRERMYNEYA